MKIAIANAAEVDAIFPQIAEKMQRGCEKTGLATSAGGLWRMCRSGEAFLFVGFEDELEVASVWRFENWPSGQVFQCMALCGRKPENWFAQLYQFAKEQARIGGTDRIIAQGRPSWGRLYERFIGNRPKLLWQTYEVQ